MHKALTAGASISPAAGTERRPHRLGAWLPLPCLLLGTFAVGADGFMVAGLLPQIAVGYRTTPGVAAQLVTVFALTYAVGAPLLASLLARHDRRVVLLVGLVGLCAMNVLGALAPALAVLFVARVGAALAASVYTPTAAVIAAGLVSDRRRGRALSAVSAGLTLSIVTGVPLGSIVGDRFGWRVTFACVALLSAAVAIGIRVVLPRMAGAGAETVTCAPAAIRTPGVARVLATTLLGILAGYLAYTYVAAISHAGAAASGGLLAVVLVAFGAGATAGALLSGAGVDRYGQPLMARAGAGLQAVSLAALGAIVSAHLGVTLLAVGFALLGAGTFNYGATPQRRLIELAPDQATTLVSLNNSAIYVGMSLSGALGALTLRAGPVANCVAGALIATLAAAIAAPARRRGGRS